MSGFTPPPEHVSAPLDRGIFEPKPTHISVATDQAMAALNAGVAADVTAKRAFVCDATAIVLQFIDLRSHWLRIGDVDNPDDVETWRRIDEALTAAQAIVPAVKGTAG